MKQGNQSPLSAVMQVDMNDRTCKVIWIFERGNYICFEIFIYFISIHMINLSLKSTSYIM